MRWFRAPAKINLSLSVLARRPDGLHEIESLAAFAEVGDWLGYQPGRSLELEVEGPERLGPGRRRRTSSCGRRMRWRHGSRISLSGDSAW